MRNFLLLILVSLIAVTNSSPGFSQEKKTTKPSVEPTLAVAQGMLEKSTKESITVKSRGSDGKFQKAVTMKLTGTSKVFLLSPQKRGEKVVITQREVSSEDLVPGQIVALIYSDTGKDELVLLSAVAQPLNEKK